MIYYQVWTDPDDYWVQMESLAKARRLVKELLATKRYKRVVFSKWEGKKYPNGEFDGDYVGEV